MIIQRTGSKQRLKWVLFVAFLLTVPVPYFMVVVGGLVPSFYIIALTVQGLIVAIPKFTAEGFWMLGILLAHVVILGGVLYLAAFVIAWLLNRILSDRAALWVAVALVLSLSIASAFEIYRMPGHNSAPPANIVRIIKSLAT